MRDAFPVLGGQTVPHYLPPRVGQIGRQPQFLRAPRVPHRRVGASLRAAARQGVGAREDHVCEDAEGPDVGGRTDPRAPLVDLGPEQFRWGVVGGGEDGRVRVCAFQFGSQVEVGQSYRTVSHQQDVGGLQIAVHPARVMQLVQALADLGQQRGARPGRRVVCQQGVQGAFGAFQDEDGGAVEFGVVRVVHGQSLVHPDQARCAEPLQQLHFPLRQFAQMAQLARGAGARRQELQGGPAGQGRIRLAGRAARVHGREGTRRQRLPYLPLSHAVALRYGDRVRLLAGHPATLPGAAVSTPRSSSRTRSKRRASETSESFLPLTRRPGSAVPGPGRSRSLRAR